MDNRPIGIFDSGLGGLTCIEALRSLLPNERIIYFGDTARTPYGSKSPETVCDFALQIAQYLVERDAKMLIIACNTISSIAIPVLAEHFPHTPIAGIIQPAAAAIAFECGPENNVGIIGTKVTIQSGAYEQTIAAENADISIYSKATPAFVPLIEEGIIDCDIMDLTVRHYLDDFIRQNRIDTLVLGCTHYPLIRDTITKLYPDVRIVDPARPLALSVGRTLFEKDLLSEKRTGADEYAASDLSDNFVALIHRIVGDPDFTIALRKF